MTELHDAVGSYAVDALDPAERAEFETHLTGCDRCQVEVSEFAEVVAELSSLTAQPAPAALRNSLLSTIGRVPQLSADRVAQHEYGGLAARPSPASRTSVLSGSDDSHPVATHDVAPLEEHPSVVPDWTWSVPFDDPADELAARRSQRMRRILYALVAAAMVVALALGAQVYSLTQRNQAQLAATQLETELLTAPDARVYTATAGQSTVRYVVSRQRNQALFLGSDLADPGASATYQLWALKGVKATSVGLVTSGGTVRQLFAAPVRDSDVLAVTKEPGRTGSPAPTTTPLFKVTI